jgi:metallo-beta-lactamase family protein
MNNIKVTFAGGARSVTGSNFLIDIPRGPDNNHEVESHHGHKFKNKDYIRVLIDCGLPQGQEKPENIWQPFIYDPKTVDYLLVTHAHLDHIGKIGFLMNQGFSGRIISTKATREISRPALEDAYNIVVSEAERAGLDKAPYKMEDVEIAFTLWKAVEYREQVHLAEGISARFTNASHVLGSAMIQVDAYGEKVLFTGDMGNNSLLLQEADIPTDSDHVFMECVYGNRKHDNIAHRSEMLEKVILDNIQRKGTLVIPAFSIERTQEVLSEINELVESRQMKVIPVYVDSPLSIEITHIFEHYRSLMREEIQEKFSKGDNIFSFPGLHMSHTRDESMEINDIPGPKIVIAGSGMLQGGRVVHHVKRYLDNPHNTIMMVGYQARGTLGSRLLNPNIESVNIGEAHIPVHAKILNLSGYSAHRDVDALLEFVSKVKDKAKSINLILGDDDSLEGFKETLKTKFGIDAHIPEKEEVLEL